MTKKELDQLDAIRLQHDAEAKRLVGTIENLRADLADRVIQLQTQVRTDTDAIEEWMNICERLTAERDALAAALEAGPEKVRRMILDFVTTTGHNSRSAMGDWALDVADFVRDALKRAGPDPDILESRDARIRRETLWEAADAIMVGFPDLPVGVNARWDGIESASDQLRKMATEGK